MSNKSNKKSSKLLDEVSEVMRLHHYSIHSERTYCNWIKKFVLFHKMTSREAITELNFLKIEFRNFNELQIKKWLKSIFCNSLSRRS